MITTDQHPGLIVARVEGRFDAHSVDEYTAHVVDAVDDVRPNVIVDLHQVEFMDSSALAALVTTLKRTMERGGDTLLARLSDAARIILELTRLDQVFVQAPSVEDARARLAVAPR